MATLTSLTATVAKAPPIRKQENRIPCTDGFDRERGLRLWLTDGKARIVLVAPPAETALLTAQQARVLSRRLEDLATVLDSRTAELTVVRGGEAQS